MLIASWVDHAVAVQSMGHPLYKHGGDLDAPMYALAKLSPTDGHGWPNSARPKSKERPVSVIDLNEQGLT